MRSNGTINPNENMEQRRTHMVSLLNIKEKSGRSITKASHGLLDIAVPKFEDFDEN